MVEGAAEIDVICDYSIMEIKKIFANNKKWVSKQLELNENYFKNLSKGQSPEFLCIGCSDSRVSAETITGLKPGDVFIHRNMGNLVPNTDLNVMSVINYAVDHLKVKHIVVCGHYYCGAVQAAMQPMDMGIINPWLRNIRDVYRLHKTELNNISDEEQKYKRLVELNVKEQCLNVLKTAVVQKAYNNNKIQVHGWVWDMHSGILIDLNIDTDKIMDDIMEIYRLKSDDNT